MHPSGGPAVTAATVEAAGGLLLHRPRGPVVVSAADLLAPRATVAAADGSGVVEGADTERVDQPERGAVSAASVAGLLGSAALAGGMSLTCFVC